MLLRKKVEPSCSYCRFGGKINETQVACLKKGVVSAGGSCPKFKYDPLRREPAHPTAAVGGSFSEEDFTL